MDWTDLHAFITITREKSISKAAQLLHLSQPTLTTRLKKLEQELGVNLLERNWKGVKLTTHGTAFLNHALKAVQEIDDVMIINKLKALYMDPLAKSLNNQEVSRKKLKIGISRPLSVSFFNPILLEMNRSFPLLTYDILSEPPNFILDLVSIGEIDLGIVPHQYNRPDLESLKMFAEEMLFLAPRDMDIGTGDQLENIDHLLNTTLILFNSRFLLKKMTEQAVVQLLGSMPGDIREVNDVGIVINMISNGLGCAILPNSFIYDTVSFFNTLHSPNPLPRRLHHESIPYQIFRLDASYPARTIQMIYSPSSQFHEPVQHIAETLASPYRQLSEALAL
ncbi:LysR family transcriptional regulator [Paenibacillus agricola]|uniref:LysR family transcriptional regulator n=1 Tax=Paenibacillus agricola TaxID=2716264 RepID=A0ABX0JAD4_9BACL|nr:LysR family transcriptional regulator [Paenibacillus agricola]NHN31738.1 LysR family transcriptional regulator [Paenibacillus agricola]